MTIPIIHGLIDRRILVNYRVDAEVLARILPAPFRPKLIRGTAMAGICLIRLKQIRPRYLPGFMGISSENAAHRMAVQWEHDGQRREGVYIPRRDTSSRLNTLAGGRLFPGVHHHARFQVAEHDNEYHVILDSDDDGSHVAVHARLARELPATSAFRSLEEASEFFQRGSLGYSETAKAGCFDGLELHTATWQVEPLDVDAVESTFFGDTGLFPPGSVEFDCALLMRGIEHQWQGRERLRAP